MYAESDGDISSSAWPDVYDPHTSPNPNFSETSPTHLSTHLCTARRPTLILTSHCMLYRLWGAVYAETDPDISYRPGLMCTARTPTPTLISHCVFYTGFGGGGGVHAVDISSPDWPAVYGPHTNPNPNLSLCMLYRLWGFSRCCRYLLP